MSLLLIDGTSYTIPQTGGEAIQWPNVLSSGDRVTVACGLGASEVAYSSSGGDIRISSNVGVLEVENDYGNKAGMARLSETEFLVVYSDGGSARAYGFNGTNIGWYGAFGTDRRTIFGVSQDIIDCGLHDTLGLIGATGTGLIVNWSYDEPTLTYTRATENDRQVVLDDDEWALGFDCRSDTAYLLTNSTASGYRVRAATL